MVRRREYRERHPNGQLVLSFAWRPKRRWSLLLHYLYVAFVRFLQLVHLSRTCEQDLVAEVVLLRHEIAVIQRGLEENGNAISTGNEMVGLNGRRHNHSSQDSGM
jgi:hypothetical protein